MPKGGGEAEKGSEMGRTEESAGVKGKEVRRRSWRRSEWRRVDGGRWEEEGRKSKDNQTIKRMRNE